MTSRTSITVQATDTQPNCPRCGEQALMTVSVPHGWDNPDGTTTVPLCEHCDAAYPQAGALIGPEDVRRPSVQTLIKTIATAPRALAGAREFAARTRRIQL